MNFRFPFVYCLCRAAALQGQVAYRNFQQVQNIARYNAQYQRQRFAGRDEWRQHRLRIYRDNSSRRSLLGGLMGS